MTLKQVAAFEDRAQSYRLDPIRLAEPNGIRAVTQWLQTVPLTAPKLIYASADATSVKAAQAALALSVQDRLSSKRSLKLPSQPLPLALDALWSPAVRPPARSPGARRRKAARWPGNCTGRSLDLCHNTGCVGRTRLEIR